VFHGARVILEGGKPVGHCRMAGIARLGEQTEIGQLKCPDQFGPLPASGCRRGLAVAGMSCNQCNQHNVQGGKEGKYDGFAHQISKSEIIFCVFRQENKFVDALIPFIWARIIAEFMKSSKLEYPVL
jgi:hypothetical protein